VRLPPKLVLDSINDFCVLFFKDVTHAIDAPPHFYKEELRMRIDTRHHDCEIKTRSVPNSIKKEAISAIIRSPLVDGRLKKMILKTTWSHLKK